MRAVVSRGVVVVSVVAVAGCHHATPQTSAAASHDSSRPPAAGEDVARLVGPTWYLQSWTTHSNARVLPDTDSPPRLVFDSRTAARTDDPTNTTTWTVTLRPGTLRAVEGPTTAVAENLATQAAAAAIRAVLTGPATWSTAGTDLTMQATNGSTATFTSDTSTALALGGAYLRVVARAYQPYAIAGRITLTAATGGPVITHAVGTDGLRFPRLAPGTYRVTAAVPGGSCTPGNVTITGGQTVYHNVACLLKH